MYKTTTEQGVKMVLAFTYKSMCSLMFIAFSFMLLYNEWVLDTIVVYYIRGHSDQMKECEY